LQVAPFVLLALVAYLAEDTPVLRFLAVVLLVGVVGSLVLVSFGLGVIAIIPPASLEPGVLPPGLEPAVLALLGLGSLFGLVSFAGLLGPARRGVASVLPMDPGSFIHGV